MSALLSIIVPVYNSAHFLPRCLDSICTQTYRNLEIICVNDGSTDGSAAILDEYAARDARIKVIHQENAGVSVARNAGLDTATGEYVTFVDADDWLEPDMFEEVLLLFDAETDIVGVGVRIDGDIEWKTELETYFRAMPRVKTTLKTELYESLNVSLWNKVYRRSLIEQNDILFPAGVAYGEDLAFVYCVLAVARCINSTAACKYHYVIHENSAMNDVSRKKRQIRDLLQAWEFVREYYMQRGVLFFCWPLLERIYMGVTQVINEGGASPVEQETVWQLVKKCGLHRKCRKPEMLSLRMSRFSPWRKCFHWIKGRSECFGVGGLSFCSVTYEGKMCIWRILGRVVFKTNQR